MNKQDWNGQLGNYGNDRAGVSIRGRERLQATQSLSKWGQGNTFNPQRNPNAPCQSSILLPFCHGFNGMKESTRTSVPSTESFH